jgi:hypothetical protein
MLGRLVVMVAIAGSGVVTRCENDNRPFDMHAPGRLDLIMVPDSDWVGRCDRMGGEPVLRTDGLYVCEGVDY